MDPFVMEIQWLANWYHYANRGGRSRSVLIIEDDLFLKPAITNTLLAVDAGLAVHWATTVAEAKRRIADDPPGLLIVDCLLGGGANGMELWEYCRQNYPEIPFLMVSGLGAESLRKLAAPAEAAVPELLQKPFLLRDFRQRVESLLGSTEPDPEL